MKLDDELMATLCCPVNRSPLRVMSEQELAELNTAIGHGRARYGYGNPVERPLEGGLVSLGGGTAYRIEDGVPLLVPALRIIRSDDAAGDLPASIDTADNGPLTDVWVQLSERWARILPPLRPASEDIELFRQVADEVLGNGHWPNRRALLLGVTPEIATMRWPTGTGLLALDSSPAMIRNVWPKDSAVSAAVARADWKAMPVRDEAYAFIIGDGILTSQRYPEDFAALVRELGRVLSKGGAVVIRLFARPEARDSVASIFDDLRGGRLANFDVFHWRLAMAMHGDLEAGTRLADVWEAWHQNVPEPRDLMTAIGWAPDAARVLDRYRGLETRISFPTVAEVREIFADGFEQVACHVPTYEDGDRYPTVVFRSKPRPAGRSRC